MCLEGYAGPRDLLQAFKWFHLSYLWSPGVPEVSSYTILMRDRVRELLTPMEVAIAKREIEAALPALHEYRPDVLQELMH
jgi:hypothetical protein